MADLPATIGGYEILSELGRGGMGVVYKARRADLNREFALKVIHAGQDASVEAVERFRREAQAAAACADHPGIVGVHDIGDDAGRVFFAMDYVAGGSLDFLIEAESIGPEEAAGVMAQAARAVQHAHDMGILHRDLKPGNILVNQPRPGSSSMTPTARVTDFGLAIAQETDQETARLTKSGAILGTPAYMAPEQASSGGQNIDARADVYGLGATLYEALVGSPPFHADSMYQLVSMIQREDPVPPRQLNSNVSVELDVITRKCLEKEPERRYQSAAELADDLERWIRGEPIVARPPSMGRRLKRWLGRHKALAAVGLAVAVTGGVAAAIVMPRLRAGEEKLTEVESKALADLRSNAGRTLEMVLELRRAGAPERGKKFAGEVEAACRELAVKLPRSPVPDFWLGRLARAMLDDGAALAHQEAALTKDPEYGPALYERAVLVARLYQARLQQLQTRAVGRTDAAEATAGAIEDDEALVQLGERLRRAVDALEAAAGSTPAGALACARGLRAWLAGETDTARTELELAVKTSPALTEAYEALASLEMEADRLDAAAKWLDAGIAGDGGHANLFEVRGRVRALRKEYAGAIEDFDRALALSPGRAMSHFERGKVRIEYLEAEIQKPGNLIEINDVRAALDDLAKASELRPADRDIKVLLNRHRIETSRWFAQLKVDIKPRLQVAIDALRDVLQGDSGDHEARMLLGLGLIRFAQGHPPTAEGYVVSLRAARAEFDTVLEADERHLTARFNRAAATSLLGLHLVETQGGTAEAIDALYEQSLADYDKLVQFGGNVWQVSDARGNAIYRRARALHEGKLGDPVPYYQAAERDFAEMVSEENRNWQGWFRRGQNQYYWASWYGGRDDHANAVTAYAAAAFSLERAVRYYPKYLEAWLLVGACSLNWAEALRSQELDPVRQYNEAIVGFTQVLDLRGSADNGFLMRGQARLGLAIWLFNRNNADPEAQRNAQACLLDLDEAERLNDFHKGKYAGLRGTAAQILGR